MYSSQSSCNMSHFYIFPIKYREMNICKFRRYIHLEQYRNCNRNGGRYPAQPNLMINMQITAMPLPAMETVRAQADVLPDRIIAKQQERMSRPVADSVRIRLVWRMCQVRNLGNSMMRKRVCAKEPCSRI